MNQIACLLYFDQLYISQILCLDHIYKQSKDSKYRFAAFGSLENVAQTRDLIHVCKWPKKILAWHFLHTYLLSMLLCTKSSISPFLLCLYMWCKTSFDLSADMAKVKETWHLLHICYPCKHRRVKAAITVLTLLCLVAFWCLHLSRLQYMTSSWRSLCWPSFLFCQFGILPKLLSR